MKKIVQGLLWSVFYGITYLLSTLLAQQLLLFQPRWNNLLGILVLSSLLIVGLILLIHRKSLMKSGWFAPFKRNELKHTLSLAIGSALLITLVLHFIFPDFYGDYFPPDLQEGMNELAGMGPLILLAIVGIVAPITEEIVFRGAIYNSLKFRPWLGILVSSALFALIHMNLFQGSYAFFLGIFMGIILLKTGSLWLPIIFHLVYNVSSSILGGLNSELLAFLYTKVYIAPILGGFLLLGSLWFFLKARNSR